MKTGLLNPGMVDIQNQLNSGRVSRWIVALYVFCLFPLSIDGFGINYLFALIPAGILIAGGGLVRQKGNVALFIYASVAVFSISSLYQIDWMEFFDRRLVSFILFMTMFSMCFVQITDKHIASFKMAVFIAGMYFSMQSLVMFISLGAAAQSFESKDIVGSQRYGFVYILAFWIILYDKILVVSRFTKQIILLTLILGISLTFSRASIVAFVASIAFAVVHAIFSSRFSFIKFLRYAGVGIISILFGIYVVDLVAPVIFDFFYERIIDYIISGAQFDALSGPEKGSDGIRIFIWSNIIDYVLRNPLTGAGFLGVWVLNLFDESGGSAHNQYFDVLFRVGPFLFLGYLYFIGKMLKHFKKTDIGLFIGLIGILVYGLFHETFKESHGMFILAMLLAISMSGTGLKS